MGISKRTTVIFVRHAQARYGEDDRIRPLTEEGLIDRQVVVDTLKDRHIDCFLCSPYRRSIETIQTTADYFGMPIITDERFRERKVGTWNDGWLEKRWNDFTCAGETIVIGTHGTALSTILNYYDRSFGVNDFLRIVSWMPYIVEMSFVGDKLVEKKELAHVDKGIL